MEGDLRRLCETASKIRELFAVSKYSHAHVFPEEVEKLFPSSYGAFKHVVAAVIEPKTIVEIGVGHGVAARAFVHACPDGHYIGFDDESMAGISLDDARRVLAGHNVDIRKYDSGQLADLPQCDLAHVDGSHVFGYALHDCILAMRSAPWVLVDDARDSQVAAAAMHAAFVVRPGNCLWSMFEDTWSGDILFYRGVDLWRPWWESERSQWQ